MKIYTYRDGLKILRYIGINSLNEYERVLICKKWNFTCKYFNNKPIDVIESLYTGALPPHSHPETFGQVMKEREIEFREKLEKSKLTNENLDEILEKITL